MPNPRKPWLAALLSVLAPGLGHLYSGPPRQAVTWAFVLQAFTVLIPFVVLLPWFRHSAVAILWLLPLAVVLPVIHAWRTARQEPVPYVLQPTNRWYIYLGFAVLSGLLGQLATKPLLASHLKGYRIPSGSMTPTLLPGDYLYVHLSPPAGGPRRTALVVYASTEEEGLQVLKRVVGVPGDTLAMTGGTLYLDGHPVSEPYVQHENPGKTETAEYRRKMRAWQLPYIAGIDSTYNPDLSDWGPLVVPTDSVFVLGDNREASYDSRYFGCVPLDHILGVPKLLYYSFDPLGPRLLPHVTAIRWERLGLRFVVP